MIKKKEILIIYKIFKEIFEQNKKILIAGNGGSAELSNHISGEFVATFLDKKRSSYPMISLCSNMSIITAIGNDFGFEHIFERQIDAIGSNGDLLVVMSTSGKSKNIQKAIQRSKQKKIQIVGLFGKNKTKITRSCDVKIHINSTDTARIQESHLYILHEVCRMFEN